jgi:type IV secretion system protein VirD4
VAEEDFEKALLQALPRGLNGGTDTVPGARWADPGALPPNWKYKPSSIFLGFRNGRGIGCDDDRHVLLAAGSRAGKGLSYVVPNLLLYEGSILAIDPKGELARITAKRRRAMGQDVFVLDPFGVSGVPTHSFNPLSDIDPESETAIDDAALLAESLIVEEGERNNHWVNGARELVKAIILYALLQKPEWKNLSTVRNLLRQGSDTAADGRTIPGFKVGLEALAACGDAFEGVVAATGNMFLGKEERELASLISVVDVQLGFLDSLPMQRCLQASDFQLSDLKAKPTTIYLCLPATRMATHAKWLRVMLNLSLIMCERTPAKPGAPLLFVMDEFPVLGYMRAIESAAGQMAGFGVKLFTIVQDLTQLKKLYQNSWETFIGNSGVTIFFGNSDSTTLEYVSNKLGTIGYDLRRSSGASPSARLSGAKLIDEQLQLGKLLEPHEVEATFARKTGRALVLYSGENPLIVQRAHYDRDADLRELLQ